MPTSPVAVEFARRIAPRLVSELGERKADIIARAGFLVGQAIKLAWPRAMIEVPTATESGADAMLDEFGGMTITQVAERLLRHNEAKHRMGRTHPSVAAAAGRPV